MSLKYTGFSKVEFAVVLLKMPFIQQQQLISCLPDRIADTGLWSLFDSAFADVS